MTWQGFADEYAPTGAIRLGSWSMETAREDLVTCRATIAFSDTIMSVQATASGPIGAMTSILHDIGAPVQIVRLHQREVDGTVTTFLLCENDGRQCWAYGDGATGDEASLNALIAGANRLLVAG
ncbi:hypothetical protein QSJ19_11875 [Gordonia sp. ABSL11-1]|uniref:hypothetical protein n=1 Tax=Gordonia sp. ABSL11-1 TaxID=3053924 RepID=UPI002573B4C9|nr:hypothetical protein [Gordonia sp. ABSL11-1]MDL9946283.1 hypothetical protein [Gordonia sp. ABSL11-1]